MIKISLAIVLLVSAHTAYSDESKPVHVMILDHHIDRNFFNDPSFEVFPNGQTSSRSELPPTDQLDQMLSEAGLSSYFAKSDQLEKDMFALNVISRGPGDAAKSYPNLPPSAVERFKNLLVKKAN